MFEVHIANKANKFLNKLHIDKKNKIIDKIKSLANLYPNIESFDFKKLKNNKNCYRLRVNDVRILIELIEKDKVFLIYKIGFRENIYRILDLI